MSAKVDSSGFLKRVQRHTPDADMVRMRFEAAHLGRSLAIVDHAGDALGGRPVR